MFRLSNPLARKLGRIAASALGAAILTLGAMAENPRAIILTDIGGREPDDRQSLIRLMLYSNEIDVLGIIATGSCWQRTHIDLGEIHLVMDAYEKARPNLLAHARGYPEADAMRKLIKPGHINGVHTANETGYDTEGSDFIIELVDANEGPVYVLAWGGIATLARSLYVVGETRGDEELQAFVDKIIVHDLGGQGDSGAWIARNFPDLKYQRYHLQWRGISYRVDDRWHDSRGGDESYVSPEWLAQNAQHNHGPLGEIYVPAHYLYEGDSPTFFNLINNGLTDPLKHWYGGWGGRFEREEQKNVRTGTGNTTFTEEQFDPYYMYADAVDTWAYEGKTYQNVYAAIFRWREDFQRDFAARMDWASTSNYNDANHNPVAVVQGDETKDILTVKARPGSIVILDGSGSSDPDGDKLSYTWWVYTEPGTYDGQVTVSDSSRKVAKLRVPQDASGKEIHAILSLRDNGDPVLTSYRRVVIRAE